MASYREPMQPQNRGRTFFSPLCAPLNGSPLEEPMVGNTGTIEVAPIKKEITSTGLMSTPAAFEPIPDAKRDFDWGTFPTYSEMIHRRVYIPGHQMVESEAGYSPDLLKFREEKAEEYALGASIELEDYSNKRTRAEETSK